MYIMVWEYQVKPGRVADFEEIYASDGLWTQLFKKQADFLSTELLQDSDHPQRYITIDRWASSEAYNSFHTKWQDEYKALDEHCKDFTDRESFLGTLLPLQSGE